MTIHPTLVPVEIKVTDPALHEFGGLPRAGTPGAAAFDLVALSVYEKTRDNKPDLKAPLRPIAEALYLAPGELQYVGVGFSFHIGDPNYAAHLIPRSSSSAIGLAMGNTVGLLDSDYAGPPIVAVWNRNTPTAEALEAARSWKGAVGLGWGRRNEPEGMLRIARGERIAQMYFAPVVRADWRVVDEFTVASERGQGGFGSTGRV